MPVADVRDREMEILREEIPKWRADPVYFCRSVLGVKGIWEGSAKIMRALRDHDRVAVAACHASSKTWTASCLAWWWALSYWPSKVITTAPTERQVRQLLWVEIRARYSEARIDLPGEIGTTQWVKDRETDPDWFMVGFSTRPDQAEQGATKFQGYHSPHVLVILDEAAAVPDPIWDATDGLMTGGHAKILAIGNPTSAGGRFYDAFRKWHSIQIDAFDTPNLRAGQIVHPHLVTPAWVEEMRTKWGEDHPAYKAKVQGLFPRSATDALVAPYEVELAFARMSMLEEGEGETSLGVDVARFGDDLTTLYGVLSGRWKAPRPWKELRASHTRLDNSLGELPTLPTAPTASSASPGGARRSAARGSKKRNET